MRLPITRGRLLIFAGVLIAIFLLVLGLVLPPNRSSVRAAPAGAALLITEFTPESSTLSLVGPTDPRNRTPLLQVPHAFGWEIEGQVDPSGRRLAYLVLPPDRADPLTEAVLTVTDGASSRVLARDLDLTGGLRWSGDGDSIVVRRVHLSGPRSGAYSVVEIDAGSGEERARIDRSGALALYPVGRPSEGPLYAVVIGAEGSDLISDDSSNGPSLHLSDTGTRDWALSPDGGALAFTEQRGLDLQVQVVSLRGDQAAVAAAETLSLSSPGGAGAGSASPVWRPDGSLSVGTFGGAEASPALRLQANGETQVDVQPRAGFTLPIAWSPDGQMVAVRAFSGRGPGEVGVENGAVVGPDGAPRLIPGEFVRVLGWWNGGS